MTLTGRCQHSFRSTDVTAEGTTVNKLDNHAVAPKPIDTTSTLYTKGTATGNMAIEVPTATAGKGVLAVRPGMLAGKVFVAVKLTLTGHVQQHS